MAPTMRPAHPAPRQKKAPSARKPHRQNAERARAERRALQKTRRARRAQVFRTAFLLSLVFALLYGVFVAVSINRRASDDDAALPILVFTEGKKEEDARFSVQEVRFGKTDYLPLSFLKDYFSVTEFGDARTRSFAVCDNGQYATFYLNSTSALVNGQKTDLSAPAFLRDDERYLPVDFFTTQMPGFTFTHSTPLAANVLTIAENMEHRFYLQEATPIAPVDPATRPVPVVAPSAT